MKIGAENLSGTDIARRCGNAESLYGARRAVLQDGKSAGMRVIDVKTTGGLRLLLCEDRCLDILDLSYKGENMGFLSKNGFVSNAYADPDGPNFVRYWHGGMMLTCGLRNAGPDNTVNGEYFPLHGRIGLEPAGNVGISVTGGNIVITGTMRETALFGVCLELRRTIEIPADGACIHIRDEIQNHTPNDEPIFLLYHINFAYPFLDEGIELRLPEGEVRPRTDHAAKYIDSHSVITLPVDNDPEQVFFHLAKEKNARAELINRKLGIRAAIDYDAGKLPVLAQWKSMGSGDYVLGVEPGTSFIRGRKEELENGYNTVVKAFASDTYEVKLSFESC